MDLFYVATIHWQHFGTFYRPLDDRSESSNFTFGSKLKIGNDYRITLKRNIKLQRVIQLHMGSYHDIIYEQSIQYKMK